MPNNIVVEYSPSLKYPSTVPFCPSEKYPEYIFDELSAEPNYVYRHIRSLLLNLNLDKNNFGTEKWNPFGEFILPGNKVVIKPNWVCEHNPISEDISGLVTHSSVLRTVIDYVLIALKGEGEITIGDAAIQSADFGILQSKLEVERIIEFFKGKTEVRISVEDFRKEVKVYGHAGEVLYHKINYDKKCIYVDLGNNSYLAPIANKIRKFRVTNYDPSKMLEYHSNGRNIYIINKSVLNADAVIMIPKLKTHRKAGITCCMKNSVGINSSKDALVHHLKGSFTYGGDAYPSFNFLKWMNENLYDFREKSHRKSIQKLITTMIGINDGLLKKLKMNTIFEGNWYGNTTLWRMILDINNILFYSDKNGEIKEKKQRNVFYIVDSVVGGEKDGPLKPDNKFVGLLAGGKNPVLIDIVISKLIGFDYKKIPSISKAIENNSIGLSKLYIDGLTVCLNGNNLKFSDLETVTRFEPSMGWKNHIEA